MGTHCDRTIIADAGSVLAAFDFVKNSRVKGTTNAKDTLPTMIGSWTRMVTPINQMRLALKF
jgi:hypothetical protein